MSTNNLCFEPKYEKYQNFLVVKFSVYLNRHVFVMLTATEAGTTTFIYLKRKEDACKI